MSKQDLDRLVRCGVVNALDFQFARFITRLAGTEDVSLFLGAALVSRDTGRGHVCCDLGVEAGKELLPAESGTPPLLCPDFTAWCKSLQSYPVVGPPGTYCPLVLDGKGRLYLYRYWEYENDLAAFIRRCSGEEVEGVDTALLRSGLERYFPRDGADGPDWQRIAAAVAVTRKLCIISGGPGTGKTTTVARILALLVEQAAGRKLRIALAAPTGKAAARLEEAIGNARRRLHGDPAVIDAIPEEASTLHRLLGTLPGSPYFRHDSGNPLTADVVIVDEASMVDLALMTKLVHALPAGARLILLGDKDQLASVEAGAVLGDICDTGNPHVFHGPADMDIDTYMGLENSNPVPHYPTRDTDETAPMAARAPAIARCIVELRRSYRFGGKSGIGALSRAVRDGRGERALALMKDDLLQDIAWQDLPESEALAPALRAGILNGFTAFLEAEAFSEMMAAFEKFRILCAMRQGPYGAVQVNRLVEAILAEARLIQPGQWYRGRPIMITTNDYNLKLFNGDIGLILPDIRPSEAAGSSSALHPAQDAYAAISKSAGGESPSPLAAFFPTAEGPPRRLPPARLPAHETVYAMTVHKSQGSEFDEVLLLLSDRESPLLTRELLYTGITRARVRVGVWGREPVFRAAAVNRVQRTSGLRDAIWRICEPTFEGMHP